MPLPPLAVEADVTGRAPDLDIDEDQVELLLGDASALVRAYAGRSWVDDEGQLDGVPDGVVGIVASMVIRALRNPSGVTQETTGPFNVSYGSSAADRLYLTRSDRLLLRGGPQVAFTVGTDPEPSVLQSETAPWSL